MYIWNTGKGERLHQERYILHISTDRLIDGVDGLRAVVTPMTKLDVSDLRIEIIRGSLGDNSAARTHRTHWCLFVELLSPGAVRGYYITKFILRISVGRLSPVRSSSRWRAEFFFYLCPPPPRFFLLVSFSHACVCFILPCIFIYIRIIIVNIKQM
jgi:hypothetical protein